MQMCNMVTLEIVCVLLDNAGQEKRLYCWILAAKIIKELEQYLQAIHFINVSPPAGRW